MSNIGCGCGQTNITMSENITEAVAQLVEEFEGADVEIDTEDANDQIAKLVEFDVSLGDAVDTVRSTLMDTHDVSYGQLQNSSGNDLVAVGDIPSLVEAADGDDIWVDVEIKILDPWEPRSDSIAQVGLAGDSSGTIKYTMFAVSELPEVEQGESYAMENVIASSYTGQNGTTYEVKPNKASTISALDEDIEVPDRDEQGGEAISGMVVQIKEGSGLIERCSEEDCTRVLNNGRCPVHGEVEGEHDLRIKAVVDDGEDTYDVFFGTEETEDLLGMDVEQAVKAAKDALDMSVAERSLRSSLVGQFVDLDAGHIASSDMYIVNSYDVGEAVESEEISEVAMRAQNLIEA